AEPPPAASWPRPPRRRRPRTGPRPAPTARRRPRPAPARPAAPGAPCRWRPPARVPGPRAGRRGDRSPGGSGQLGLLGLHLAVVGEPQPHEDADDAVDRKSTRLNSSHVKISYAVFCLKKKKEKHTSSHDAADIE